MNCPFSGKPCDKYKSLHVTENVNGVVHDMEICADCSASYFASDKLPPSLQTLQAIINLMQSMHIEPTPYNNYKKCSSCGWTIKDIAEKEKLGCEECYKSFEQELETLFKKSQGGLNHVGKIPKKWAEKMKNQEKPIESVPKRMSLEASLSFMQSNLDACLATESYEEACYYRDEIKKITQAIKERDEINKNILISIKEENYEKSAELKKQVDALNEKYGIEEVN